MQSFYIMGTTILQLRHAENLIGDPSDFIDMLIREAAYTEFELEQNVIASLYLIVHKYFIHQHKKTNPSIIGHLWAIHDKTFNCSSSLINALILITNHYCLEYATRHSINITRYKQHLFESLITQIGLIEQLIHHQDSLQCFYHWPKILENLPKVEQLTQAERKLDFTPIKKALEKSLEKKGQLFEELMNNTLHQQLMPNEYLLRITSSFDHIHTEFFGLDESGKSYYYCGMAQQTPTLFMWYKDSATRNNLLQRKFLIHSNIVRFEMPIMKGAKNIIEVLRKKRLIANNEVDHLLYTSFHHFCITNRYNKHLIKNNKQQAWAYIQFLEQQGYTVLPVFYAHIAKQITPECKDNLTIKVIQQKLKEKNQQERDYACHFITNELRSNFCSAGPAQSSCLSGLTGGQLSCGATAYQVLRLAYPNIPNSYFLIAPGPVQVSDIAASYAKQAWKQYTQNWTQASSIPFKITHPLLKHVVLLKLRLTLEARCHWKRAELAPLNAFSTALRKLALLENTVVTPHSSPQFNQPQFVYQINTCLEHPNLNSRLRKGKTYRHLVTIKENAEHPMPCPNSPIQIPYGHCPSASGLTKNPAKMMGLM